MKIINTKKLKISNPKLNNLGCYALSSKIYLQKKENMKYFIEDFSLMTNDDKLGFCIKTYSIVIDSIQMFTRPLFRNNIYLNSSNSKSLLSCDSLLEELRLNRELRVYCPFSITSLLNELIVVTLKDEKKWYELVGEKVEVSTTNYIPFNITAKLYIRPYTRYSSINELAIKDLHLSIKDEAIPKDNYWENEAGYQSVVEIPIDMLHSVEVRGGTSVSLEKFTEYGESFWTPDNIYFSYLNLKIDYSKKVIEGSYSDCQGLPGGRRTSNGWEDKYHQYNACFYKLFDFIYSLKNYIDHLPDILAPINGYIKHKDVSYFPEYLTIAFDKELTFKQINEVMKCNVSGSEYIFYL